MLPRCWCLSCYLTHGARSRLRFLVLSSKQKDPYAPRAQLSACWIFILWWESRGTLDILQEASMRLCLQTLPKKNYWITNFYSQKCYRIPRPKTHPLSRRGINEVIWPTGFCSLHAWCESGPNPVLLASKAIARKLKKNMKLTSVGPTPCVY